MQQKHKPYRGAEDTFEATCAVCGEFGMYRRERLGISGTYHCANCSSSLRFQAQARTMVERLSREGSESLAELVHEAEFAAMRIWEAGEYSRFRKHLRRIPGYEVSAFWTDCERGEIRDGMVCQDIMDLTFDSNTFDLVITSEVFEHVRHPYRGFSEVHRVLSPGGVHVFTIPLRWPMRPKTVPRVDVSDDGDRLLLEAHYHGDHLVYNDFGQDLLDRLDEIGFDTDVVRFSCDSDSATRQLTFWSVKR